MPTTGHPLFKQKIHIRRGNKRLEVVPLYAYHTNTPLWAIKKQPAQDGSAVKCKFFVSFLS
jgi:hypothetical protein